MSPQDLLELLHAEPFVPFEMQVSTGERFVVRHPENLLVGRTRCYLPIFEEGLVERMVYVALVHIVTIELLNGQPPARARGKRKRQVPRTAAQL